MCSGEVAPREEAAVHRRMQRLHPAVEHLGKVRDLGDVAHRESGVAQRRAVPPVEMSSQPSAEQAAGEVEQAGSCRKRREEREALVRDAEVRRVAGCQRRVAGREPSAAMQQSIELGGERVSSSASVA